MALAHVRGGGELGAAWHHAARGLRKQTSANDLIDALRWLHSQGISCPARTTAAADSAGALALGGLIRETPELVGGGAIVRSGFVDPIGAMSDASLPLSVEERDEWGDPSACEATRRVMAEYSPVEAPGGCPPPLLAIAAERDARVPFTQSLEYVTFSFGS